MHAEFWTLVGIAALVCFILFAGTWAVSLKVNNFSFVDAMWALSLPVTMGLVAVMADGIEWRRWLAFGMAAVWGGRLGGYLFFRILRHHPDEDVRYQVLRKRWAGKLASRFFAFFQAQAVLVVLLSVPLILAAMNLSPQIHLMEVIGLVVWGVGIGGEALSDAQMKHFKSKPENKGKVCKEGLWGWSRHPNYFFEFVTWVGFWLFAAGSPWGWLTVYAPAMILYFLLRVTGIPLTEECAVASKGDAYREYQRSTSAFIPLPPKKSSSVSSPS